MYNTRTTSGRFDTEAIRAGVDILALVESQLGPCPVQHGQLRKWNCPLHGEKTPSFTVYPHTQSWYCFGCHAGGNVIDWIGAYKGIGFKDACRYLENHMRSRPAMAVPRPPLPTSQPRPVADRWQRQALTLVKVSEERLWNPKEGREALNYLRQRGLSDETIRKARLGYNTGHKEERTDWGIPLDGYSDYVWIDNGIAIPFLSGGIPQRLTIRRYPTIKSANGDDQRYKVLPGSAKTLYNGHLLNPARPAILTEGVFDALSVQQEAGDLLVSVATDSTCGARTQEWIDKLAALPLVLVAYDADEAGDTASEYWLEKLPNARRLRPPQHDPNAMLEAGTDLRSWVQDALS